MVSGQKDQLIEKRGREYCKNSRLTWKISRCNGRVGNHPCIPRILIPTSDNLTISYQASRIEAEGATLPSLL